MKPSDKRIAFEADIMKEIIKSANTVKDPIKERSAKEANIMNDLMKELGGIVKTTFTQVLNENVISEMSPELMQRAIGGMKDRGMDKRASKLTDHYVKTILGDLAYKPIGDGLIITGFGIREIEISKGESLIIYYGSPRSQEYNRTHGQYKYNIDDDSYNINHPLSREAARIFSVIATRLNPNTKYKNTTANFQIKDH